MDDIPALKDPHLPPLIKLGDFMAPKAPVELKDIESERESMIEMAVKLAATVARFTTEWAAEQLQISMPLVQEVLIKITHEGLVEELWQTKQGNAHYKITPQGRELAVRLMEVCGYVGPAPVPMEVYSAMLRWQFEHTQEVKPENVAAALSQLVLTNKAKQMAGLAAASGRSLFVYGPPGNGKSSLGRAIRAALPGDYWVPYAISLGSSVVRMFDAHCHDRLELPADKKELVDNRWVRIKRPLVVVGGELTLELLELNYSPIVRMYEAPPHLKANGGVFLVDDFGRERVSPEQLLNRFITPMEHSVDYFTLRTGQKIQLPLRHVLIIATNISLERVTDPAFLRRMGYRVYLGAPTEEQYRTIFNAYAQKVGVGVAPEAIDRLLQRYKEQNKELRCCEPRDLIERGRDICKFHNRALELTNKVLDLAWTGYFGENAAPMPASMPSILPGVATLHSAPTEQPD